MPSAIAHDRCVRAEFLRTCPQAPLYLWCGAGGYVARAPPGKLPVKALTMALKASGIAGTG